MASTNLIDKKQTRHQYRLVFMAKFASGHETPAPRESKDNKLFRNNHTSSRKELQAQGNNNKVFRMKPWSF